MRRVLLFILACLAILAITRGRATAENTLTIGSPAPAIDVEHWLQDGNGFFKPVKTFEKNKVYVVEFWATWCGPCIMSMPSVAEMQNKYRGQNVQIIGLSSETEDEVKQLMGQRHPQAGKLIGDITSAYCLGADPDESVYNDYMTAAHQDGVPTCFIIGKTGLIEWIGSPFEMEPILESVVTDQWDRQKFGNEFRAEINSKVVMQRLDGILNAGQFAEAIEILNKEIAEARKNDMPKLVAEWTDMKCGIKIRSGKIDAETLAFYRKIMEDDKDNPIPLGNLGYWMFDMVVMGGDIGPLGGELATAIHASIEKAPQEKPFLYSAISRLHTADLKFDLAIAAQEKAIAVASSPRQVQRLSLYLAELKKLAASHAAADAEKDAKSEKTEKVDDK